MMPLSIRESNCKNDVAQDFIFKIHVSEDGFMEIDSPALQVFDERSHSTNDCDLQLGYHVSISDTGVTLIRGLFTLNVPTKDAHSSKFLVFSGEFMKNGIIVHLKLGFHELIYDKGGTSSPGLFNLKPTGDKLLEIAKPLLRTIFWRQQSPLGCLMRRLFLPSIRLIKCGTQVAVLFDHDMCYCKGIREKGGGSKFRYLVTTLKVVPRGTDGAMSVEGTFSGLLASIVLAFVGCAMGEISAPEAMICVIASQIANLGESIIGAAFQEKEGFRWLNNDAVNVINISMGSILAVLMQQFLLQNWSM